MQATDAQLLKDTSLLATRCGGTAALPEPHAARTRQKLAAAARAAVGRPARTIGVMRAVWHAAPRPVAHTPSSASSFGQGPAGPAGPSDAGRAPAGFRAGADEDGVQEGAIEVTGESVQVGGVPVLDRGGQPDHEGALLRRRERRPG